jgi:hypothetical protein
MYRSEMLEILKMKAVEAKIAEISEGFKVKINKSLCKDAEEKNA